MNWQVAIDIEAWECLDETMLDILEYASNNSKVSVLFSERLYDVMSPEGKNLIDSYLSSIDIVPYEKKSKAQKITLIPDLTQNLIEDEIAEVECMAYQLWKTTEPPLKLYAINESRNSENAQKLTIERDRKQKGVDLLTSTKFEDFQHRLEPILEQAKHIAQQERNIGGETVSTFKAWNPHNDTYARELLKQAWYDTTADDVYPKVLYVWDSQTETYVRFMHSGNGEYHGHDFAEFNRIPDEVKERYHHWKK